MPAELTTGCFVVKDEVPGVGECAQRVTHAALNKDRGLIDPDTGKTTDPTTPRGMVEDNFAKAVSGAIAETRRQWTDFQSELTARYGKEKGALMICALTHDDPVNDCRGREWTGSSYSFLSSVGLPLRRSPRCWFCGVADAGPASPDRHEAVGVSAPEPSLPCPDRRSSARQVGPVLIFGRAQLHGRVAAVVITSQPRFIGDSVGLSAHRDVRGPAVLGLGTRPARRAPGDPGDPAPG